MKLIQKYFSDLSRAQLIQFEKLESLYKYWNSKINVISRKDISSLYLKHVLHSLAIAKFIQFSKDTHIIDVGTGGGFPGIPLAILFPDAKFHLVDSIEKKVKVVDAVSKELSLKNVTTQCKRVEGMNDKFDFVLARAVADMSTILKWTENNISPNSNNVVPNGIIALKGGDLDKELSRIENKKIVAIKDYFDDHYFINKKLVYVPVK
ncbi:MAG: 16S rRNA (guanine(527)-N(7))-methyltransferase RsmG [Flavobacteriales bacterium]|nr:16S rRNA (guanine(527)-N(7))-methyltransferase RsmG [Flavobacteriales bacterium]